MKDPINDVVRLTMRMWVIFALLSQVLTEEQDPFTCKQLPGTDSEYDYLCPFANGSVTFQFLKNDYVNLVCEGSVTEYCSDPPLFDFASGLTLPSLGLNNCPPSLLRCINDTVDASSVSRVTLVAVTEHLTEEDVVNLGQVHALTMRKAEIQTSIPTAVIKSLPTLTEVRLGGGRFDLTPHAFDGAPNLTFLELGQDELASIPPDSFTGLSCLLHLSIWGNNIKDIGVGALRGLEKLTQLSLGTNKLRSISPGTFRDVPKLKVLHVMGEAMSLLPNGLLQDLNEIQNLTLIINRVPLSFGENALSGLPSLKNVILSRNSIQNISETLFQNSTSIEIIDLSANRIQILPEYIFKTLQSLKILNLNNNDVKELFEKTFIELKKLEYLYMNDNHLESLPQDLFSGLKNLKEIHFDRNRIASISSSTFSGPINLHTLSLGYNRLSLSKYGTLSADRPLWHEMLVSPFKYLENLKKLNLSNNRINVIYDDWRLILHQLEDLNLSHNAITHLAFDGNPDGSYFLNNKITIDLSYNEIRQIFLNHRVFTRDSRENQSATLLLNNNPFKCDCAMYYVKLRIDGKVSLKNEPNLDFDNAKCSYPPKLNGSQIIDVSPDSLVCNLTDREQSYTLFARPATNELLIDSSYLPKVLPDTNATQLQEYFYQIPTINVKTKHQPISLDDLNIHTLDLSNTNMKSIDFMPSSTLKVLNLSNNYITKIPDVFLKANISMYLSNNPLECSCSNQNNIASISVNKFVHDAMCSDGRLINSQLDIAGICHTENAIIIGISTFIVIAVCVIIISSLMYAYFNEIIICLIKRGWLRGKMNGKEYDIFISFCHTEDELVSEVLLPKLEKEFRQKVCVHHRDWLVGLPIPVQIKNSVEKSRKTIILLSKDFLDSEWANQEFYEAHNLSLKENTPRIILILLEENLKKHPKLSTDLKAYISTNTYLLWDDPNFTKKLGKAVTALSSYTINFPDASTQMNEEIKSKKDVGLDVHLLNGQLVNMGSTNM